MVLNQSPLPNWATCAHLKLILTAGFEPAIKQFLKLPPLPVWLREQTKFGGSEGIQTLTRSVQDFYALSYITNPVKESTDGESRTRKNWFLGPAPLPFGYVGVKNCVIIWSGQSESNRRVNRFAVCRLKPSWLCPQLNWSARRDLNPQSLEWKSSVQPFELHALGLLLKVMSGAGFEPAFCRVRSALVSPVNQTALLKDKG